MTRNELAAWKQITESSRTRWCVDFTTMFNRNEVLAYTGGTDGVYVRVGATGVASTGTYEGAYPHIGEALLREQYTRTFDSQEAALASIGLRVGAGFLGAVATALGQVQAARGLVA